MSPQTVRRWISEALQPSTDGRPATQASIHDSVGAAVRARFDEYAAYSMVMAAGALALRLTLVRSPVAASAPAALSFSLALTLS